MPERGFDFEGMVGHHQHAIFGFALNLTGSRSEAEEVAQETFVRAWRALDGYSPERLAELRPKPWLHTIALNVVRNRARTAGRSRSESIEGTVLADPLPGPEARALQAAQREGLRRLLRTLPEAQMEAVVLRHVQGFGYAEAAALLERPVGTVKSDCHRGLARLRATLAQSPLEEVS